MVPKAQIRSIIDIDEQPHSPSPDEATLRTMHIAGRELAAKLGWLPGASSDTFAQRCRKLAATFKSLFASVDQAFAKAPKSEDLLWLRDNAQQLSSEVRGVANELAPLTAIPHVSTKNEIEPRVLAIAQGFFRETGVAFSETKFTEFCLAF